MNAKNRPGKGGNTDALRLKEIDAYELQQLHVEELTFLQLLGLPGYLVEGWSHVVAGYPRCGKTELLYANVRDWIKAGRGVLYMTEESRSLWQQRLARRPVPCKGLNLKFALGELPLELLARLKNAREPIVVVDTLRGLGITPEDENDNGAIARAVTPWVAAARRGRKTLILLHHDRKGGGEHGEGISGGHALLAAVDVALQIKRDNAPNRRVVKMLPRVIQASELLYERQPDDQLVALGDPAGIGKTAVAARALAVLDQLWTTTKEVLDRLEDPKPSLEQLRLALLAEARVGRLERDPPLDAGRVDGKTIRWRKPGSDEPNLPHPLPRGLGVGG
jgi:predicted ATP-dependent serine protease